MDARILTPEQLEQVLELQKVDGRRLGTLLVEIGLVTETQLTQILSQQLSVPWVSLYHIDFSRELLSLVPRETAERFCLVPIYVRPVRGLGDTLYVAMDDPMNEEALLECSRSSGLPTRAMIAAPTDIRKAVRLYYGGARSVQAGAKPTSTPLAAAPAVAAPAPAGTPAGPPAAEVAAPEDSSDGPSQADLIEEPSDDAAPLAPDPVPELAAEEVGPEGAARLDAAPPEGESGSRGPAFARPEAVGDLDTPGAASPAGTPDPMSAAYAALARADQLEPDGGRWDDDHPQPSSPSSNPPPPAPGDPPPDDSPELFVREVDVPRKRRGRQLSLTLLDGTTIALGPSLRQRPEKGGPPTAADIVQALRGAAQGKDPREVLGDEVRWEKFVAAILNLLIRKHLILDREFIEELKKI